jgi:hypothetical protein
MINSQSDTQFDYLVLQGKKLRFERVRVRPEECRLDPRNPRIQYLVGLNPRMNEAQVEEVLWEKDKVKALYNSIEQNGGVREDLVLERRSEGGYLVREGNCRTVAERKLVLQYPGDQRFETMPAMVFDEITEEDLAVLLADMHVAGKIQWDAFEQAKHVFDLYTVYGKTYEWLSNHLRLSKSKITEYLAAYQATQEYLDARPDPANVSKFSLFHEVMRKKDLREKFRNDPEFKQSFHRWVASGKLTDSKQVRELGPILEKPEALEALEASGVAEALKVLYRDDPSLSSDLFKSVKEATSQLKKAPASEIQELSTDAQKLIMLRNLSRAVDDLATLAGVKL